MRNDLLLALRMQRGWTQEELSERSGISVRTIRNLERGRIHSPRRSSLDLLLGVLDPELRSMTQTGDAGSGRGFAVAGGVPAGLRDGEPGGAEFGRADAGRADFGGAGRGRPRADGPRPDGLVPRDPGHGGTGAAEAYDAAVAAGARGLWRGPQPPRTPLIGREQELDRLCQSVADTSVTILTGPGGVGKTRLALAAAQRLVRDFPGGVAVAQLGRLAAAVGAAGGEGPAALNAARQAVVEVLGDERQPSTAPTALLVLDTTEHLPQLTALLVEHLRETRPDLRLVITTRRPPAVPEARILEVEPLGPDQAAQLMHGRLASSSVTGGVAESTGLVEQLCRELDHVPRLIEFAAYWLRNVPPTALLSLEHVVDLLGFPDFSVLPHQRSLRDSLEWSWAMLSDSQRRFMVRLAEQPEPVASDALGLRALDPTVSDSEAFCLLADLADASLLQVSRGVRYEYRMLRHVRAYVRHRVRRPAAGPEAGGRQAEHCQSEGGRPGEALPQPGEFRPVTGLLPSWT